MEFSPYKVLRFIAAVLLASGCVSVPDPPPEGEDLSELERSYEHPTATIPNERVREIMTAASRHAQLVGLFEGLLFLRTGVSDASVGLDENTASDSLDVQGRVKATVPCPGNTAQKAADAGASGALTITLGVKSSEMQRRFTGSADNCELLADVPKSVPAKVVFSGKLDGDLGANLPIGETVRTHLLIKLKGITGKSVSASGTTDLKKESLDFRLTPDNAVESVVNTKDLSAFDLGTAIVILRADGTVRLRDSRGEWQCAGQGGSCSRVP